MAGNLSFDDTIFKDELDAMEHDLQGMEVELREVLMDFIREMPEMKSILASETGRSKYSNEADFWLSLAKDGATLATTNLVDIVDMDKMLKYIAENYNDGMEGKTKELMTKLEEKRQACVSVCKEKGIELLKKQQEIIKQNEEIIQKENEELTKLKEQLKTENAKKIELEKVLNGIDANDKNHDAKVTRATADINACDARIQAAKDGIDKLTVGPDSIEEHKKAQADFKRKLMTNKKSLLELLGKNGIKVQNQNERSDQNGGNDTRDTNGGGSGPTVREAQEAGIIGEETTPVEYKKIDSREAARNMLRNFRGSSKQMEMLDGMGYGDIAAMIKHLGPIGRRELRNSLKNRADELGITPDNLDDMVKKINEVRDFMRDYDQKTPLERKEFEENMQKLKYAALLQDANRGFIRRGLSRVFSRSDERVGQAREVLTEYGDKRVKRNNQRFGFLNSLRKGVGKPEIEATKPENYRGNRDSRNALEQRDVPDRG